MYSSLCYLKCIRISYQKEEQEKRETMAVNQGEKKGALDEVLKIENNLGKKD